MHAHEHVLRAVDVAVHERDVLLTGQRLLEQDCVEVAPRRRQANRHLPLDKLLVTAAVLDQVRDGEKLQSVLRAELEQVGNACHRSVVLHDLAHDARRDEPGETREVDCGLRLSGALEHAAGSRAQREHVTGLHEVPAVLRGIDRDLDRARAVLRGDAGRDPFARLDGDGERGAVRRLVALGHHPEPELVAALAGEAETDETAPLLRHERDRLRRRELRGDSQVALVLAVGGVDDDDHAASTDLLYSLLDAGERSRCHVGHLTSPVTRAP